MEEHLDVQAHLGLVRGEHIPQCLPTREVDDGALSTVQDRVGGPEERHMLALVGPYGKVVLHVPHMTV